MEMQNGLNGECLRLQWVTIWCRRGFKNLLGGKSRPSISDGGLFPYARFLGIKMILGEWVFLCLSLPDRFQNVLLHVSHVYFFSA